MSANLVLVVLVGVLFGCGSYLLLARSLTRVLVGVVLLGNGVNLLILAGGGPAGLAPLLGRADGRLSDPLPQAMILTAIVITFGLTAFMLALAHRSWQLFGHDEVQDDVEDRRIRIRSERERAEIHLEELTDPAASETMSDTDFAEERPPSGAGEDDNAVGDETPDPAPEDATPRSPTGSSGPAPTTAGEGTDR